MMYVSLFYMLGAPVNIGVKSRDRVGVGGGHLLGMCQMCFLGGAAPLMLTTRSREGVRTQGMCASTPVACLCSCSVNAPRLH